MRDAREEVVLDLIVQATIQHAELRAADVRRRRGLLLQESRVLFVLAVSRSISTFREVHAIKVVAQKEEERELEATNGRHPQTDC